MPYQFLPIVVRSALWKFDPDLNVGTIEVITQRGNETQLQRWSGPVEYGPQFEVEESVQFIPLNPRLLDRVPLGPRRHRIDFRVDLYGAESSVDAW